MTMTSSPIDLLRKACTTDLSTNASLSNDGKVVTLCGSPQDASTLLKISVSDGKGGAKEMTYSLASIYLQLLNPGVLQYRKACDTAKVEDPVKVLDKVGISEYFFASASDVVVGGDAGGNIANDDMDLSGDEVGAANNDVDTEKLSNARDQQRPRISTRGDKGREKDGRDSRTKHRSSSHSKSRRDEEDDRRGGSKGSKAPKGPISNEQLVANLSTIVDKRDAANLDTPTTVKTSRTTHDENEETGVVATTPTAATPMLTDDEGLSKRDLEKKENDERELLLSWLSPEGFRVDSPTISVAIEADREAVRRITALEIPVGDSASILRAGAGGEVSVDKGTDISSSSAGTPGGGGNIKKRDFARVLEIYHEVIAAEEGAKRASSSSGKRPPPPPPPSMALMSKSPQSSGALSAASGTSAKPVNSNPIIVVPNAMTSAITMINAGFFLGKEAVFIPRDQAMHNPAAGKRGGTISITRKLAQRLGGSDITYDIIDNPATRLKKDEWNNVVAVFCQGAAWQFKGWRYSDPVDLFSRTFGFYVGFEGAAVPNELRGWNVKTGKVSRDRRGLDNVCLASFWSGLEEFMAVHKQEFIKTA